MSGVDPRCPDCGVATEPADPVSSGYELQLRTDEQKGGLQGALGVRERLDVTAFVCPECGLVRWYADVEG